MAKSNHAEDAPASIFCILCICVSSCGFRHSRGEALTEHCGALVAGRKPFADVAAIFLEAAGRQKDQLRGGIVRRELASRLDGFAE